MVVGQVPAQHLGDLFMQNDQWDQKRQHADEIAAGQRREADLQAKLATSELENTKLTADSNFDEVAGSVNALAGQVAEVKAQNAKIVAEKAQAEAEHARLTAENAQLKQAGQTQSSKERFKILQANLAKEYKGVDVNAAYEAVNAKWSTSPVSQKDENDQFVTPGEQRDAWIQTEMEAECIRQIKTIKPPEKKAIPKEPIEPLNAANGTGGSQDHSVSDEIPTGTLDEVQAALKIRYANEAAQET